MAPNSSIFTKICLLYILLPSSFAFSNISPLPFKKIYAFGDSYTDTGNTKTSTGPTAFNYVSNPPYGETFFHRPTNRYSDGRILLDLVAETLSLPYVPPYLNPKADRSFGVNFAVGGATAIRHGYFVKNNAQFNLVNQSLQTQLVWFDKIAESEGCKEMRSTPSECKAMMGDALVWLGEIGANDYTASTGSSIPRDNIRKMAVKSTIGFIQALVNKGAKYIVVQGLPLTGCSTYTFIMSSQDDRDKLGCVASMNRLAYTHNTALQAELNVLKKQNPEAVIIYLDYYGAQLSIFENFRQYGFKEQYKVCCGYGGGEYNFDFFNVCGSPSSTSCGNPSEYINWDGAHFTEAVYKAMMTSIVSGKHCFPPFSYLLEKKIRG